MKQTKFIRRVLPGVLERIRVKSLMDAGCGDHYWLNQVSLRVEEYIGVDCVPELIALNEQLYGNNTVKFVVADIVRDRLPNVDLIMCRDVLVHLSFRQILSAIRNFKKSGSRYILATTFPQFRKNYDIVTGEWHRLNLQISPFNFPYPVAVVNEGCTEGDGKFRDKSLGLWRLTDIRI